MRAGGRVSLAHASSAIRFHTSCASHCLPLANSLQMQGGTFFANHGASGEALLANPSCTIDTKRGSFSQVWIGAPNPCLGRYANSLPSDFATSALSGRFPNASSATPAHRETRNSSGSASASAITSSSSSGERTSSPARIEQMSTFFKMSPGR